MTSVRVRKNLNHGAAQFTLDSSDLAMATNLGLLKTDVQVQDTDPSKSDFGVAYCQRANVASETHGTQKAIQARCKEFAQSCGFQLAVSSYSSKPNQGGNAKYVCKILKGMHFYDHSIDPNDITCPFSINVSGINGNWKVTRVNFTHNHVKHVGFSGRPFAERSVARPASDMRNRAQDVAALTQLVEDEMLPRYENKTERMTGAAIASFLLENAIKLL
ncbi:hypothetical protein PPTG_13526 [Phytophthora nicotianae INRA-310]|uniref:Uncharacterized protein n=1 Tax=Phytophthora nicotianae (strain INRA-310) TaxID=761204 RepID=W2Q3K2_PHYN3|nr:hypothetical protein PPTG_13526 [Phytophthora nicotianae INRA-310]ETN07129.1 hypothetical protein PPTG_13526 [Phytophthora nicotianae INRA-310]